MRLPKPNPLHLPLLSPVLLFALLASAPAAAMPLDTPPQIVAIVDQTPVIIEAPSPFIEVSRVLRDAFAQRSAALASANGNRLLAWLIPALSLKEQLDTKINEKAPRCRTLQVQAVKDMEPVHYDSQSFKTLRVENTRGYAVIAEENADALFAMLDLNRLAKAAGGQKILGVAELGVDSFTLCIAIGTEGSDQFGGRDVETSVTCVTYMLIKGKVILLSVSGPELTAKELRNSMRLSREWIALLRDHNPR